MRLWTFAPLFAATFSTFGLASGASADTATRISDPKVHENLAIYFVHGPSAPGPVPLTLQEAVAGGTVVVSETGQVNELVIENTGAGEVFIQAGDIVKGGKQDRVLTVSLLLPPKSGKVPIASFCVEQGRWANRGKEDVARFNSANEAMPSRAALLAMVAPPMRNAEPSAPSARLSNLSGGDETSKKQRRVWDNVARTQENLRAGLGGEVASPQSATSLQLSLENEKLKAARADYVKSLQAAGEAGDDIIGYVVAINGQLSSANIYPSNGLFRKMWGKQLVASVTEAIGERARAPSTPDAKPAAPPPADAGAFLAAAEKGKREERATVGGMRLETRDTDKGLFNETKRADGRWVYRNYLAK